MFSVCVSNVLSACAPVPLRSNEKFLPPTLVIARTQTIILTSFPSGGAKADPGGLVTYIRIGFEQVSFI